MPRWKTLEQASTESSFLLSADWTAAWLGTFAESLQPEALTFRFGGRVVGACLLVSAMERRGPFRIRRLYVNTSGEELLDRSAMEFNGVLCIPGFEKKVAAALTTELHRRSWDECVVEGCSLGPVLDALLQTGLRDCVLSTRIEASRYVDLARLRRERADYDETLSRNTLTQIRRSLRSYESRGPLQMERASDRVTATAYFKELIKLHQGRWLERGHPGAFASERKTAFHRALIDRGVSKGTVDLLRITAGGSTVGVLYNFVYRGKVYFYQSGFSYEADPHLKPGLVSHYLAIKHYQRVGLEDYDFMAGDLRYKRSLATGSRPLCWVTFRRQTARMNCIERLRVARRWLRGSIAGRPAMEA